MSINLNYSDGSHKTITTGFTTKGFSSSKLGKNVIIVEYDNYSTSFSVDIIVKDVNLLKYSFFENSEVTQGYDIYDHYGNYYDKCLLFNSYQHPLYGHRAYAIYRTAGCYKRYIGTFSVEKHEYDSVGNGTNIVNIYADDVLIYTRDNITKFDEPIVVDLDISNCNFLKIQAVQNLLVFLPCLIRCKCPLLW